MQTELTGSSDYPVWIESYKNSTLFINQKSYHSPIAICNKLVIPVNKPFIAMQYEDFLVEGLPSPEIIILGTGLTHLFLSPQIQTTLFSQQIFIETMTTDSAVRTFNLLITDNRRVWAWLWPK